MKRILKTFSIILFATQMVQATHIVGGEFEILHIEGDRYLFRQIQYFDVVNGNPQARDFEVLASVFRKRDDVFVKSIQMGLRDESYVPYTNPSCTNDQLITNRMLYSAEVILDPELFSDPQGYYLVWERCCRNGVINNIIQPDQTGQTFYIEFPPIRKNGEEFRNSSPQLFPPLSDYACVDRFYYADFRGSDPDGDSLVYSLSTPLNSSEFSPLPVPSPAPHPTVNWITGINTNYQIPGNPTLNVDERGFLTVTPAEEGLFVFSVKCEEYRDGEKIGEVLRDFQLYVIDCPDSGNPPEIQVKTPGTEIFTAEIDTIKLKADDIKCFDFKIKDKDGSETITLSANPVNFEANLQSILSTDIGYLSNPDATLGVQVCLPDCPYLQNEPFVIDVIARDNTCPQPLMDTIRLIVLVEPPPNKPPKFTLPIEKEISTSFTEGALIDMSFSAEDQDLDSLLLYVRGDGFELRDYGIEIDTLLFEAGKLNFQMKWNTDCQVYPFGLKNEFKLKFYIEDADQCGMDNRDSITMNITIDLPDNNEPIVLIDNEHINKELIVRIEDELAFDVRATDADPTDQLQLSAVGVGFDLEDLGIVFENQIGSSNIQTELKWKINCGDVNLDERDIYEIMIMVEDADKCKIPNADTVLLTLNILPPINTAPVILVDGNVLTDTVFVNAGKLLDLEVSGVDSDNDLISMRMENKNSADALGVIFEDKSSNGQLYSPFSWQTDCSLLGMDFMDSTYSFQIILDDHKCLVPESDTLDMQVVVRDTHYEYDFIPPNVFTPNDGDTINQSYYIPDLPGNNCVRKFEGITIYNRLGKEVFSSLERDFHWSGEGQPSGVYYYRIGYTGQSVKGTVTILR